LLLLIERNLKTIHTTRAIRREAASARALGRMIVLVSTMGCLHEGHLSLIRRARKLAGAKGKVIVTVFVNKTQFEPDEDFENYPRTLKEDMALCRELGTDIVFAPSNEEMYTANHSTFVIESHLSKRMEGASRPKHFRGVTTVMAKLFNLVQPDVSVFGEKDWQQATIIRRMTADLNFPVRIVLAPTVRESDGLAMSSRNKYLSVAEREQATVLHAAIRVARAAVKNAPTPLSAGMLRRKLTRLVDKQRMAKLDYIEFFDPTSLEPTKRVSQGTRIALAVFLGKTRLIDNSRL